MKIYYYYKGMHISGTIWSLLNEDYWKREDKNQHLCKNIYFLNCLQPVHFWLVTSSKLQYTFLMNSE